MNVIEIPETGKRIEYPSTWEECSPSQVQYIFREADRLLTGDIDPLEFRIRIFYHLAGIIHQKKHQHKERLLTEEQQRIKYENIIRASETVGFMFQKQGNQLIFKFDCIRNLIPRLKINHRVLHGPAEAFFNITFGEYRVAYDYYIRFVRDHDENDLNNLCSVLYRPARSGTWNDDIRIEFNPYECYRQAKLFHKVAPEVRSFIVSWFGACDNYFKTGQIEIDGRLISLAPLFRNADSETNGVPDADTGELGLTGILMSVADNGTFGPVSEVEKTNLYTVLLKLYQWHLEHKRLEKIYNKHGKLETIPELL
mgnify:FL=1